MAEKTSEMMTVQVALPRPKRMKISIIINQHLYREVLAQLRERVRKKRPDLWKNNSWVLHQDNTPAHTALSVKTFPAKYNVHEKNYTKQQFIFTSWEFERLYVDYSKEASASLTSS
uniref:Uncharacterized protein n=1 Tax=Rhodnius prolixus TaxID=13249 RepID=T1I838_RHOPR